MSKFRKPYEQQERVQTVIVGETLAQQNFKDECDVNNIIKRINRGQNIGNIKVLAQKYGDFTQFSDYQDSLNKVIAANEMFDALPAAVRDEFKNDPAVFVAAAADPKQAKRFVELGLATLRPVDGAEGASAPQNAGAAPSTPTS